LEQKHNPIEKAKTPLNHIRLGGAFVKFAAMNLKKLATWKWKARHPTPDGGKQASLQDNPPSISLFFPFAFLLTNQKPALA